jgi:hypothetical protein
MNNDKSILSQLIRLIIWGVITIYIIFFFNFQFSSDANLLVRIGGLFLTLIFGHLPFIAAINCLGKILSKTSKGKYGTSKLFRYMEQQFI